MEKKSKVVNKRLQKQLNELVSNRQFDEAIQLLEPIARKGNADAQYKLGKLLYGKMTYTGARWTLESVAYWMKKEKQLGRQMELRREIQKLERGI